MKPDTKAREAEIVVLDFEGTGAIGGFPDEPWQIGMIRIRQGRIVSGERYESLLRIGERPFSPYAPGRHAQFRGQLAAAPALPDLWPELRPWWSGAALAAHNAATERKFLRQAFPLHQPGPWIDTLKLVRVAYPRFASHTLEDMVKTLQLTASVQALCPDREPHDALYDAAACATLLVHLIHLNGWTNATVAALAAARPDSFYRNRSPGPSP